MISSTRNSSWFKSGKNHPQFGKENHWGKHTEESKAKISRSMKGKTSWNKGIKNSTGNYWLGKSNKKIIVKHHIDANKKNNKDDNFLLIRQDKHRSLHWQAYEYLVSIGLVREYLKWFILKYDINIMSNDGKLVHHVDCKRYNNHTSNLIYLEDRKIHNKLHQEAYLYLVSQNKIQDYIEWFLSTERLKTPKHSLVKETRIL
jgi:Holliday junction resolvase-like predicted endonuclease